MPLLEVRRKSLFPHMSDVAFGEVLILVAKTAMLIYVRWRDDLVSLSLTIDA